MELDNTSGTSDLHANFMPAKLAEVPESATLLVEVRGMSGNGLIIAASRSDSTGQAVSKPQLVTTGTISFSSDGVRRLPMVPNGKADAPITAAWMYAQASAGGTFTAEVRISLYEGGYAGPYLPWGG